MDGSAFGPTGVSGSPFWRNSAKQGLGAQKQGPGATGQGTFTKNVHNIEGAKVCLDSTGASGSFLLRKAEKHSSGAGKQGLGAGVFQKTQ